MSRLMMVMLAAAGVVAACSNTDTSGPLNRKTIGQDTIAGPDTTGDSLNLPGTIAGLVFSENETGGITIPGANVWLYTGDPSQPRETWSRIAITTSQASEGYAGYYRFDSVPVGAYIVRAEAGDGSLLAPGLAVNVHVASGQMVSPGVFLSAVSARGIAYLRIWLRTNRNFGVCGDLFLNAAVGDANGEPLGNPGVTWTSSNTAVATIADTAYGQPWAKTVAIHGESPGLTTITASSGGLRDTVTVQVFGNGACPRPGPVATVTVSLDSARIAVGDSLGASASPRDTAGTLVTGRPVSWTTSDSSVFVIEVSAGTSAVIRGRGRGTALLRATVDGKTGQATVTVH